ncbi:MAG TPA: precorrin-2 C(20)-methyltransferase [Xanthobacteraceae bacterium]|jgi:precorrin-2/cobalt-factor-2 C20-methyltransferase
MSGSGKLIGVGIGPGDPELLTLKAVRALRTAHVIAHFAKAGRTGHARGVVAEHVQAGAEELPLHYPVTTEIGKETPEYRTLIRSFFDASAAAVASRLDAGRTVAVLSLGDPLFYGSYMHLHVRLASRYPTEVIAGVTGMSGCWSSVGTPIAQGDDVLGVIPATLPEPELARRMRDIDAAVVMKLGRHLPKVRRVLEQAGRLERAIYVERGTLPGATAMRLADKRDDQAPYFALVLVPGWEGQA